MRKLKVYGGTDFHQGRQRRHIVAAKTKKEAVALLQTIFRSMSMYCFNGWWSETGNSKELSIATEPGIWVWVGEGNYETDLKRLA